MLGWDKCSFDGFPPYHAEPYRANRVLTLVCNRFNPFWIRVDIVFYEFLGKDHIVNGKVCDPREATPDTWLGVFDDVKNATCRIAPSTGIG